MASKGNSDMFLYWGSGSAPCWKPMIVLEEKGLSGYGNKQISFSDKGHKSEEVMKLNPRGQVPTFKDGNVVVNESGAICFYLEDKYGDKGAKLLPTDSTDRARVLQRIFEASNVERVLINEIVYYNFMTPADKIDKNVLTPRYEAARTELGIWNGYLEETKGFIAGKDFSMADIFVFPYLAFGVRVGLNLGKFPALKTYYDTMVTRPSIQASWPPHWKDSDGKDMMSEI